MMMMMAQEGIQVRIQAWSNSRRAMYMEGEVYICMAIFFYILIFFLVCR